MKQKQNNISPEVLYGGKIPPHSRDLERNILGGLMIDNSFIDTVSAILKPKHFYVNAYGMVFDCICNLHEENITADIITIADRLQATGKLDAIGGPVELAELSTAFSSQESIVYSANKILANWIKRDLIQLAYSLSEQCYDPTIEAETLLNKVQQDIFEIISINQKKEYVNLKKTVSNNMEFLEKVTADKSKQIKIYGVPSGYDDLDKWTGGFQNSELIIIAGRPSHGKTALGLNIARNAARQHGKNIGIFSIEMSNRELGFRYMVLDSSIDLSKMKTGNISESEFMRVAEESARFQKLPANILIDDTSPLTLFELRSKARNMKSDHNIDMLMIDYLQLMDYSDTEKLDRHLEVAKITRGLKQLAKELDIPVAALAQLSRKVEERGGDKRPMLSDLRESGAIEQDADVIIFINRPQLYHKIGSQKYNDWKGIAEIIVAKQRNGPVGDTKLTFIEQYAAFLPYSDIDAPDIPEAF